MANSYETMLREVLMEGSSRPDRTGTGTTSLFGGRIEYDLRNGFPLITSKRVPFRLVAEELLWFIRGDTDIQYLKERDVHIWDEWADSSGEIGPMYGRSWRAYGEPYVPRQELPPEVPSTYLGVANGRGKEGHPLAKVWEGMISRCYDQKFIGHKTYGGRGVQVCSRWLEFMNFAEDAPLLPGYREGRVNDNGDRLTLDKDQRGNGKLYSPDHCMWLTDKENCRLKNPRTIRVEDRSGTEYVINSVTDFAEEMGFDPSNFYDLWSSKKGTWRNGYRLVSIEDDTRRSVDQIAKVIQSIKEDPYSRRHVVSAWNVSELDQMALAPCHIMFQFYVEEDDVLSIQVYQRSSDFFLGAPFNIASYALLTHMVAHVTGYGVGRLIWVGGDCHIYDNHRDQVKEQLGREHVPLPELEIVGDVDNIDDFTIDNFKVTEYNPHPTLKGVVAV